MYNPASGDQRQEYIELLNIEPVVVKLYDPDDPNERWKFTDGIEYTFPANIELDPNDRVLVVKDLDAYLGAYDVPPAGVLLLWPYDGKLGNGGEKLELSMPGDVDEFGTRYYIRVDRVNYSDGSHPQDCPGGVDLWPFEPDGGGASLTRIDPFAFGNDPNNWSAEPNSPGD
jgi:hypothetical protein